MAVDHVPTEQATDAKPAPGVPLSIEPLDSRPNRRVLPIETIEPDTTTEVFEMAVRLFRQRQAPVCQAIVDLVGIRITGQPVEPKFSDRLQKPEPRLAPRGVPNLKHPHKVLIHQRLD